MTLQTPRYERAQAALVEAAADLLNDRKLQEAAVEFVDAEREWVNMSPKAAAALRIARRLLLWIEERGDPFYELLNELIDDSILAPDADPEGQEPEYEDQYQEASDRVMRMLFTADVLRRRSK